MINYDRFLVDARAVLLDRAGIKNFTPGSIARTMMEIYG